MIYKVIITRRAKMELELAYSWWAENRDPEQAYQWYHRLLKKLRSLSRDPAQYPLSIENDDFSYQLRQLNYGLGRKYTHRVIFTIRENQVIVLRIRHLSQEMISPDNSD